MVAVASNEAKRKKKKSQLTPSGFLGDYSDLEPAQKKGDPFFRKGQTGDQLVFRKNPGALQPYKAWIVDQPLIYFHPEAVGGGVDRSSG